MKIVSYCVHSKNIVLKEVMPEGLICLHDAGMTPTDEEDREKELVDIADFIQRLDCGKIEFFDGRKTRILTFCEANIFNNVGNLEVHYKEENFMINFKSGRMYKYSYDSRDEIIEKEDIDIKTLFIY